MAIAALVVSILSALGALGSVIQEHRQVRVAADAVEQARVSAEAATRSADLAEVVEAGRHHGWRVEPRHNPDVYVLPNVGTVNARNVTLTGEFHIIDFAPRVDAVDIEAGQAQFFQVMQTLGDAGGQIHITWTPDMPDAQPLTWTESLPIPVFRPRLDAHDLSKAIEKLAQ